MEAAVQFLRAKHTEPIPFDIEEAETEILRMYAECRATALVRLVIDPPARDAAKVADFLVQYRLWLWTRCQNCRGVAPGRLHLMRQATKEIPVGIPAAAAQVLLRRPLPRCASATETLVSQVPLALESAAWPIATSSRHTRS